GRGSLRRAQRTTARTRGRAAIHGQNVTSDHARRRRAAERVTAVDGQAGLRLVDSVDVTDDRTSSLVGPNAWLVDEMYEQYKADANAVPPSWQEGFADYGTDKPAGITGRPPRPGDRAAATAAAAAAPAPPAAPAAPTPAGRPA